MIRDAVLSGLLAILIVAWPTPTLCQQSPPAISAEVETLTLEQAIALALGHNRLVNIEELEVEKAADRTAVARTRRMPRFNLMLLQTQMFAPFSFHFGRGSFGVSPAGPVPARDTTLSPSSARNTFFLAYADQPLSQLHRIGLGVKLHEVGQKLAENKLKAKQHDVASQTKHIYYALLQQQSALAAAEDTIKLYRELDRIVGEYVVQRISLDSERMDVQTRLAREEFEALTLRNALATQKETLNALMGRDLDTDFNVSPLLEKAIFEVDLPAARQRALEQRPEAQEARLKLEQAEFDQRIKKSEFIHDVSLIAGYFGAPNLEILPTRVAGVGVLVKWEPFDWGRKRRELAEKRKTVAQAANALREAETRIALEVNQRFRKMQEARALLRISELEQQAEREKLRVMMSKYKLESALLKDLLHAQSVVAEAKYKHQQALMAFWTARSDFEKAIGEL